MFYSGMPKPSLCKYADSPVCINGLYALICSDIGQLRLLLWLPFCVQKWLMFIFSLIHIGLSHQINILGDDDDGGGGGGGGGSGGGNGDVMVMVSYHEYDIRQQNSI